jgi:hypothetical protein
VLDIMSCGSLPFALRWTKAALKTYCNYEVPMVWLFDSFRYLTVTCILKLSVTEYLLYKTSGF